MFILHDLPVGLANRRASSAVVSLEIKSYRAAYLQNTCEQHLAPLPEKQGFMSFPAPHIHVGAAGPHEMQILCCDIRKKSALGSLYFPAFKNFALCGGIGNHTLIVRRLSHKMMEMGRR